MIQTEGIFVGGSAISAPIIGEDFNWSGGDGTYQGLDDGGGNWRIKFLSSGTFTPLKNMVIDVFFGRWWRRTEPCTLRCWRRRLHHHCAVCGADGQRRLFHRGRCGRQKWQ